MDLERGGGGASGPAREPIRSQTANRQPGEDAGLSCGGDRTSSATTTGRQRGGSAPSAAVRVTRRSASRVVSAGDGVH
ncbi:hypothetical protein EYF80_029380 [Liparis tanakae]|uniref:Uncharacterized protein n=1 Tax=Liparis tanakae TaxID=230148 RepID=A0A4Z2H454_9TELE|nr:hypothetical protein EYF80_029380 [Liparis tanakae]